MNDDFAKKCAEKSFTGNSDNGMVSVTIDGVGVVKAIQISDDARKSESLSSFVMEAFKSAQKQADDFVVDAYKAEVERVYTALEDKIYGMTSAGSAPVSLADYDSDYEDPPGQDWDGKGKKNLN